MSFINTSISKLLAARVARLKRTTIRFTSATLSLRYPSLPASLCVICDFVWLPCPSVKSFNRKQLHIGIRRSDIYPESG